MRSSSCVGPTRLPVCVLFLGMAIFGVSIERQAGALFSPERLYPQREIVDRWRCENAADRQRDFKDVLNSRNQPRGHQGIAAQLKEVVVSADLIQ